MSLRLGVCDCCWLRKGFSETAELVLAVVSPASTPNCVSPALVLVDGTTFSVAVARLLLLGVRFVPVFVREVVTDPVGVLQAELQ